MFKLALCKIACQSLAKHVFLMKLVQLDSSNILDQNCQILRLKIE